MVLEQELLRVRSTLELVPALQNYTLLKIDGCGCKAREIGLDGRAIIFTWLHCIHHLIRSQASSYSSETVISTLCNQQGSFLCMDKLNTARVTVNSTEYTIMLTWITAIHHIENRGIFAIQLVPNS